MPTDLRRVQSAVRRPHRCALIPFIGQNHPEGYIDTGTDFWGERVYFSVAGVKECAKLIGWVPGSILSRSERETQAQRERVRELEAEVGALQDKLAAVDVLRAAGYSTQRKPGRKPKETANAA